MTPLILQHNNNLLIADCIPDKSNQYCVNCGWKPKKAKHFPRRNCTNPPNLQPAAEKLEIIGKHGIRKTIPAAMTQRLARWVAAGMPMRVETHDEAMDAIRAIECKNRSIGGFCRKIGCGKDQDKNVACVWLYKMATESCSDELFTADYPQESPSQS